MKKILIHFLLITLLISCKKEVADAPSNNTNQNNTVKDFTGKYVAYISAGVKIDVPCNVEFKSNGNIRTISISGNEIKPTIVLTGIYNATSQKILIDNCTNLCYQGDSNISSGGFAEYRDNKLYIKFNVYDPEYDSDGDGFDYVVKEK